MGGFTPPVATPATTNSGVRSVAVIDTATSLVRDVDPDVQFEFPNDTPLTVITKAIRSTKVVDQRKWEWPFMPEYPKDLTVSALATAAATQIVLGANEYQRLHRGMQVLNVRTGEVFTIGGSAEPSSATIDIIGRANAQQMNANDALRIIGSAMEENAEKPAIRSQQEVFFYNYTQAHYKTWGTTFRAKNSKSYIGSEQAMERRKALQTFNRGIEEVAINGWRNSAAATGYSNSTELTYTGGARFWVQSNVWNLGGTRPTENQLFDYLGYLFQYGQGGFSSSNGEARKIAFLSPAWFSLIEGFAKQRIQYDNITDSKRRIGIKVGILQSSIGDLMLKLHPLFALPGYRDKMLVLDLNQIKYVNHRGLDTMFLNGIQTPGSTRQEDGVLTDCGFEFNGDERAHGWVEGLALATGS